MIEENNEMIIIAFGTMLFRLNEDGFFKLKF